MVLIYIYLLGVLQASNEQTQVKYWTPTLLPLNKAGRQKKIPANDLSKWEEKTHSACICVYIHLYPHIHTHTHLYTHTHIYTHIPTHTYTCTYTHTYTHAHTYTYTYTHACIYTYIHTPIHLGRCIHIPTHTHTYTHICIHTYIYIYTYVHLYTHTYIYLYTHTYTYIYIHMYIFILRPPPSPAASTFQPRVHCPETIHPLKPKQPGLTRPGMTLGLWQPLPTRGSHSGSLLWWNHFHWLVCSLRKTVCSRRYIGLFRNISGVG